MVRRAPPRKRSASATLPPARLALREQAREVYRDAILEAAAEVLVAHGYNGTRMQDVAARAGVSTGTLYNHFPSKVELTVSLLEHRANQLVARLDEMLADPGRRGHGSIIEGIVYVALGHLDQSRALFELFESSAMAAAELGPAGARCDRMKHIYMGALIGALEKAAAAGELRSGLPLDAVAIFLGGMFHSLGKSMMAAGSGASFVDRAPILLDVFLHGVGQTR